MSKELIKTLLAVILFFILGYFVPDFEKEVFVILLIFAAIRCLLILFDLDDITSLLLDFLFGIVEMSFIASLSLFSSFPENILVFIPVNLIFLIILIAKKENRERWKDDIRFAPFHIHIGIIGLFSISFVPTIILVDLLF